MNKGYNRKITEWTKSQLNGWLITQNITHFFTIRLPFLAYTTNFDKAEGHLRKIVKRFEKSLLGCHWKRYPLHFVGFAERGRFGLWHWHLLLLAEKFTTEQLLEAMIETRYYMELSKHDLDLQPIDRTPGHLNGYCMKEIWADNNGHFDSDRFIFSWDLLNLPVKSVLDKRHIL